MLGCALGVIVGAGCTEDRVLTDDGESSGTMPSTSPATETPTSDPIDPSDPRPSTGSTTLAVDDTTSDDTQGAGYIARPDVGGPYECDIWAQDCPPGQKCMPWIEEGGSSWDATRCSPIADDPAAPGEPCQYEGWGGSGIDDCELGAMCWDVDPRTNEGICRGICLGTFEAYYCEDPWEHCAESADGLITLCVPICDPLAPNCPEGQMCVPVVNRWECARDDSGEQGAYGDACEFINVCDPGLVCLDSSAVPPGLPCEGAAGCCTEVCDLADPLGDMQCAGAAEGQTCQPWYQNGEAPAVLENVGVCMLPQ